VTLAWKEGGGSLVSTESFIALFLRLSCHIK